MILLESGDRLAPEFPDSLATSALHSLQRKGVEIHLNARVSGVTTKGVKTESGEWIRSGTVI